MNATSAPTVELAVSGMTCTGCSGTVEAALTALPGVRAASVDHVSGKAVVLLEAGADPEAFAFDADAAVHDAGYTVESADVTTAAAAGADAGESCCGGGGCC